MSYVKLGLQQAASHMSTTITVRLNSKCNNKLPSFPDKFYATEPDLLNNDATGLQDGMGLHATVAVFCRVEEKWQTGILDR
jgi:hypothetical protein